MSDMSTNSSAWIKGLFCSAMLAASVACAQSASDAKPVIVVNALDGVPIDPHLYGSNNYWYHVPDARFDAFAKSLKSDCGVTLMRFPGALSQNITSGLTTHWRPPTGTIPRLRVSLRSTYSRRWGMAM